jgi:hypothetical protein
MQEFTQTVMHFIRAKRSRSSSRCQTGLLNVCEQSLKNVLLLYNICLTLPSKF